tara:strand:- start:2218 stop:2787 length:570 start_codon:yes stop_codon:yes gene_type:complete
LIEKGEKLTLKEHGQVLIDAQNWDLIDELLKDVKSINELDKKEWAMYDELAISYIGLKKYDVVVSLYEMGLPLVEDVEAMNFFRSSFGELCKNKDSNYPNENSKVLGCPINSKGDITDEFVENMAFDMIGMFMQENEIDRERICQIIRILDLKEESLTLFRQSMCSYAKSYIRNFERYELLREILLEYK